MPTWIRMKNERRNDKKICRSEIFIELLFLDLFGRNNEQQPSKRCRLIWEESPWDKEFCSDENRREQKRISSWYWPSTERNHRQKSSDVSKNIVFVRNSSRVQPEIDYWTRKSRIFLLNSRLNHQISIDYFHRDNNNQMCKNAIHNSCWDFSTNSFEKQNHWSKVLMNKILESHFDSFREEQKWRIDNSILFDYR